MNRLFRRLREFLQSVPARAYGSFVADTGDGITRLSATAPTVTAEEVEAFERRPRTNPLDYDKNHPPIG